MDMSSPPRFSHHALGLTGGEKDPLPPCGAPSQHLPPPPPSQSGTALGKNQAGITAALPVTGPGHCDAARGSCSSAGMCGGGRGQFCPTGAWAGRGGGALGPA